MMHPDLIAQSAQRHLFSLYFETPKIISGSTIRVVDSVKVHRILEVLRLRLQQQVILFDSTHHAMAKLVAGASGKKGFVELEIGEVCRNVSLQPQVTLCVGMLKKAAWHEVAYAAAQMGVDRIIPLITERSAAELPDQERLQNIMIAACEQSKQYSIPKIEAPVELDGLAALVAGQQCWYADPQGTSISQWAFEHAKASSIAVAVGPEAGFTPADIQKLEASGFAAHALTPTVLRACDAVVVSLGIIRSFCRQ
jgi:16S rRNA (uracil1498-N3)-methyltransferase